MSVRVVARIRPLLKTELDKDTIIDSSTTDDGALIKIPNPRNESESFSFNFNSVYEQDATQQQLFDAEIAPTVKSLFKGIDVTVFAYGATGCGKTHTMRGGKSLADRGLIPRLLSSIYRRARKIEKDTDGETKVEVSMSYYEIYCDRVHDLFEAPEKRTAAGLPIRDNGGKTVVVGLTERPCTTLKDFEQMYDSANLNRSTGATKLNAHSSRSHAILSVKVKQISADSTQYSTVSAIDLAGSEDNRRTDNGKERMVESAAINKSLFVLAQCVEAISKKQSRIPYRESRMTRILSLGQSNGVTIMILNLAPVKSYHLDTLSSLNFANRTKRIETNEVENQPVFRAAKEEGKAMSSVTGPSIQRQPLKPKNFSTNIIPRDLTTKTDKPVKSFSVYAEKSHVRMQPLAARTSTNRKRTSTEMQENIRPAKMTKLGGVTAMSAESIEAMIDRKVSERLASAAMDRPVPPSGNHTLSAEVQSRLDALERRIGSQDTERSEGLQYLLMAKQHQVRSEDASALRMYELALPFFPGNEKLLKKISNLQARLGRRSVASEAPLSPPRSSVNQDDDEDASFRDDDQAGEVGDSFLAVKRPKTKRKLQVKADGDDDDFSADSPRTKALLRIINTRDVEQIRLLKGVGAKKAEMIVNCMCDADELVEIGIGDLGRMKGVGVKGLAKMRDGLVAA